MVDYASGGPATAVPISTVAGDDDPTAVMGRRTLAAVIDVLLFIAIVGGLAAALGERTEIPSGFDETLACDEVTSQAEAAGESIGQCFTGGDFAFTFSSVDTVVLTLVQVGWPIAIYVFLQGLTGATPGKFLTGLRVVKEDGSICGIGRSTARTLLWIVDAAPYCVPGVVGFITGLTTTGHRRVGDLAAKTNVVGRRDVGRAPMLATAGAADQTYPPPGPPSGPPMWGPPGQPGQWGEPYAPQPSAWNQPQPPFGQPRTESPAAPAPAWSDPQPQGQPSFAPEATPPSGPPPPAQSELEPDEETPEPEATPEPSRSSDQPDAPAGAAPDGREEPSIPRPDETDGAVEDAPADPRIDPDTTTTLPGSQARADQPFPWSESAATQDDAKEVARDARGSDVESESAPTDPATADTLSDDDSTFVISQEELDAARREAADPSPASTPGWALPDETPTRSAAESHQEASQGFAPAAPPPQWDVARSAYIQWDPSGQQWLQWDAGNERWKLIDT